MPVWPWDPGADADDAWGNTSCAVLLLGKSGDEFGNGADSDERNGMLRERIGIGELSEELLCELSHTLELSYDARDGNAALNLKSRNPFRLPNSSRILPLAFR